MILAHAPTTTQARLLLDAGHGEYRPEAEGVTIAEVFSPLELDVMGNVDDERFAAALAEALPAGAKDYRPYDPTWCLVIAVEGGHAALQAAWERLLGAVAVEPSGDDDTFDYWPSAARLALEMAIDLDALYPVGGRRRDAALRTIEGVLGVLHVWEHELREKIDAQPGSGS